MALKNTSDLEFLEGLKEFDNGLSGLGFSQCSFNHVGYSYFVDFKQDSFTVKLIYGPPEYHATIIISTKRNRYEFKDLLQIPVIAAWVECNKRIPGEGQNTKNEIIWFFELVKVSLPVIK